MTILSNLAAKAPKVALILAIMAALAIHQDSFFGINLTHEPPVDSIQYNIAAGYGGPVPVDMVVGDDGTIDTVTIGNNNETARFVGYVIESGFLDSWDDLTLEQAATSTPDAVSGATFTSNAIAQNVRSKAAFLNSQQTVAATPLSTSWLIGQFAILAVVAAALICYMMPAKTKKWRIPLLIASIGVLGFWQGAFISFELLYKWIINGSQTAQIAIVVVAALGIVLPLMLNKSFYCAYLCPFGAMQEMAGKISKRKIAISPKTLRVFRYVKQSILVVFVVLIFILPKFQPSSWEPFTAFIFNSAALSSIIIAGVSIVGSILIPRAWCRLLCPTGEIFNLLQRRKR